MRGALPDSLRLYALQQSASWSKCQRNISWKAPRAERVVRRYSLSATGHFIFTPALARAEAIMFWNLARIG
jgi:hypothetical protein